MGAKIYDLKILWVPGIAFDRSLSKFHGSQTQEFKFQQVPGTCGIRSDKAPGPDLGRPQTPWVHEARRSRAK